MVASIWIRDSGSFFSFTHFDCAAWRGDLYFTNDTRKGTPWRREG